MRHLYQSRGAGERRAGGSEVGRQAIFRGAREPGVRCRRTSENGTWRSEFLSGAAELRSGNSGTPTVVASPDILAQLPPELFFDAIAIQVNGPKAWDLNLAARWSFPDHGATYRTTLHNGTFSYTPDGHGEVTLTLTVPRRALAALAAGDVGKAREAGLALDGDASMLKQLISVLQPGDPAFNIIEP